MLYHTVVLHRKIVEDEMISWILAALRVITGLLIIKTGFDLLSGKALLSVFWSRETSLTGVFIILLGVHIVCATFSRLVQEKKENNYRRGH